MFFFSCFYNYVSKLENARHMLFFQFQSHIHAKRTFLQIHMYIHAYGVYITQVHVHAYKIIHCSMYIVHVNKGTTSLDKLFI